MADSLATISVDRLNKAVNNAVRLSRLSQLSETHLKSSANVPKGKIQGSSLIAATSKGPMQIAAAKHDHVFIKPSSGVPKKKSDGVSGTRSSSTSQASAQLPVSLPSSGSPSLRTGTMANTASQMGVSSSTIRPSISTLSGPAALSSPTILSGPMVKTVTQMGLSSPMIRPSISTLSGPATLSPPTITTPEGVTLQVQMPFMQSLPPGTQIINSFVPQGNSPVLTLDGKALRLVPIPPGKGPGVVTSSQPINVVQQLNTPATTQTVQILSTRPLSSPGISPVTQTVTMVTAPVTQTVAMVPSPVTQTVAMVTSPVTQTVTMMTSPVTQTLTMVTSPVTQTVAMATSPVTQTVTMMASPVTQTVTMVTSAGPTPPSPSVTPSCNIDAPDLLAAATQAAVPHLITRYPSQKPVRTVLVQGIGTGCAQPKQTKAKTLMNNQAQPACSNGGTSVVMATTEPSSPTVQQSQQANNTTGTTKRKTVYAILVNQDCTTTPSKGQLEHLMTELETYHPVDEAKSTDVSSAFTGYFCPGCNRVNPEECGMHTINAETVSDSPILSRARATLPTCLRINPQGPLSSQIRATVAGVTSVLLPRIRDRVQLMEYDGVGSVEAAEKIKKFTKFGPLVGIKKEGAVMAQTPYLWKVFASQTEWLDCSDEEQSNWMRFVRQATLAIEQNVIAYLVEENIYFMTLEDIKPNTELRYWYAEDYAKHIGKSLHPGGGFTCLPCLKLFDSLHALNQHRRYSHADTSKRKFKCRECERTFASTSKCKTHMLSHTGHKPHFCQFCHKRFSDQSNLRMHLLIHTDVRNFECTVCKRLFKQKAHLTSHMLTHTGEKNMECKYCGKLFARRSDLRQHELQHTKEQIHECDHPNCKKVFYKLQNLKKHQKIHFGVRDFACQKCRKTFSSAYHLKRHVNNRQDCCQKLAEQPPT